MDEEDVVQMNLSTEKKSMDLENRLVAAWGEREGVGGIRSAGLLDANYCSWNGLTVRSCCAALRTMARYLHSNTTMGGKIMYTCMCNLVPMLYSGEKKNVVYIHSGILLSHKKEQNNAICNNMDGTRDPHTEWSKSERERQIPCDITYI